MDATASSSQTRGITGWKGGSPAASAATARRVMMMAQRILFKWLLVSQTQFLAARPILSAVEYHPCGQANVDGKVGAVPGRKAGFSAGSRDSAGLMEQLLFNAIALSSWSPEESQVE